MRGDFSVYDVYSQMSCLPPFKSNTQKSTATTSCCSSGSGGTRHGCRRRHAIGCVAGCKLNIFLMPNKIFYRKIKLH